MSQCDMACDTGQTPMNQKVPNIGSVLSLTVVCDLPAAQKTAALSPSISKIFCSVCLVWDECDEKGHIVKGWQKLLGRCDPETWSLCNVASMCDWTIQWRDAPTVSEQDSIFQQHGVQWSPLWRLPYWNPCRQLVVDSMHCLLEGLVKYHYLEALRLTDLAVKTTPKPPPAFHYEFSEPEVTDEVLVSTVNEQNVQWSAKLIQCLTLLERLQCRLSIMSHDLKSKSAQARVLLGFQNHLQSCDLQHI
jgi:hypothetical protein